MKAIGGLRELGGLGEDKGKLKEKALSGMTRPHISLLLDMGPGYIITRLR